jgi:hypothetical protein
MSATAKDLTVQEQEERAELAFQLEARVKRSLQAGRVALWDLAEALYDFDKESGWGPRGYEKLSDWLADPDVSMTSATYYRLVGVWRKLHVQRKLPAAELKQLDVSKVAIVLPAIENGEAITQDALDDAQALGARDLRKKYIRGNFDESTDNPPVEGDEPIDATATPVRADEVGEPEPEDAEVVEDDGGEYEHTGEPFEGDDIEQDDDDGEQAEVTGDPDPDVATSLEAWAQLRDALIDAERSGATNPRIPAVLIGPGLEGLDAVLDHAANQGGGLFDRTEEE